MLYHQSLHPHATMPMWPHQLTVYKLLKHHFLSNIQKLYLQSNHYSKIYLNTKFNDEYNLIYSHIPSEAITKNLSYGLIVCFIISGIDMTPT